MQGAEHDLSTEKGRYSGKADAKRIVLENRFMRIHDPLNSSDQKTREPIVNDRRSIPCDF